MSSLGSLTNMHGRLLLVWDCIFQVIMYNLKFLYGNASFLPNIQNTPVCQLKLEKIKRGCIPNSTALLTDTVYICLTCAVFCFCLCISLPVLSSFGGKHMEFVERF